MNGQSGRPKESKLKDLKGAKMDLLDIVGRSWAKFERSLWTVCDQLSAI